ncbi:hypothetical protein [Pseudogemmobacter bohemicus]|uniref:hypothetical protein n=1 Tax=Pseudogemmobacter bohemicus TaxID=2250708 RepID=UPI000DD36E04|nr:hypothetical protein [Pseudogemmobacter bohemicus]
MARLVPYQEWWTAEVIAAAKLPDLPGSRQGVEAHIKRHDWRGQHLATGDHRRPMGTFGRGIAVRLRPATATRCIRL